MCMHIYIYIYIYIYVNHLYIQALSLHIFQYKLMKYVNKSNKCHPGILINS